MKIALVQTNTVVGDISGNQKKMIREIKKAKQKGAELVCFHEMSLLGYPPRDLLELPSIIKALQKAAATIASYAQGIAVVFGTVVQNTNQGGKSLYNAAFWCEDGSIKHNYYKRLLPNYDVFDEVRYFEPGSEGVVVDYKGVRFGLSICEDIWQDEISRYSFNPIDELVASGAEVLLNLSASPYSMGKYKQREKMISALAVKYQRPVIYINQVGGNDELIFDGGSMLVSKSGQLIERLPFFEEDNKVVDLFQEKTGDIPLVHDLSLLEEALVTGLRDYVRKCGFKKVALGLSGGIDSALVAALACKALGSKNVLGLLMPSRYSSKGSLTDAFALAKNLKMKTLKVPIDLVHKSYEGLFRKIFAGKKKDTTEENVQARIRGNILMAVSNKLGHLVLSTGNKSELAVGYCTLYGDMSGGLAVISDVPKTLVYELALWINSRKKLIPESSITKAPSAELRPHQTDQDSLPSYEILDSILKAYIEELKSIDDIVHLGFKKTVVQKVIKLIRHNEYKRRQAAPGLKVTSKAFGMGRRYPIAAKIK